MKTKFIIQQLLITAVILCLPSILHADVGGFGDDVQDNAPIDGGLSLLVAAGIGYGAKKIRDKRNKQRAEKQEENK